MDMTHKVEKWAGRLLLGSGFGFMVLVSIVASNIIADPSKAHDPLLVAGFIGGSMLLGAPVGLLVMVLPILRRVNRHKDKQNAKRQFTWMHGE